MLFVLKELNMIKGRPTLLSVRLVASLHVGLFDRLTLNSGICHSQGNFLFQSQYFHLIKHLCVVRGSLVQQKSFYRKVSYHQLN